MRAHRVVFLALACLATMAALPPRSAQADKDDGKAKARELLQRGDRRFQKGEKLQARGKIEEAFEEYEQALADYQAAFEAYSDPQIFFPIALAEQRLGRFVESLGHYQQLLEEGKGLSGELRARVQRAIIEVKRNLAAVRLEVKPDGATILIDGREVARSPMNQPAFVEPGQHTYAVTLEGHAPVEGKMDLLPGKEMRRRIDLERMPVVVGGETGAPPDTSPVDTGTQPPSRMPLYIGLGVTGALALGGATTGILALSRHSKFRDESIDMGEREDARHSGKKLAGVTDILLGGAVVGALVTTYYYYAVYLPKARAASGVGEDDEEYEEYEEYEEEAARLQVTPVIGDGVAGVAAWGRF